MKKTVKKSKILLIYLLMSIIVFTVVTIFSSIFYCSSKNTIIESVESKLKSNVEGSIVLLDEYLEVHQTLVEKYYDQARPVWDKAYELLDEYTNAYIDEGKSVTEAEELANAQVEEEMKDELEIVDTIFADPDFSYLVDNLRNLAEKTGVTGIYTININDTSDEFYFVLDTDPAIDPRSEDFEFPYFSIGDPYLDKNNEEDKEAFDFFYEALNNPDTVKVGKIGDDFGNYYTGSKAIVVDGKAVGVICVDIYDSLVETNEASFILTIIILQVAILGTFAISGVLIWKLQKKNYAMQEAIEKMAYYDSLTNLPNRASLMQELYKEKASEENNERLSAALFIDLDNFKKVNDTRGHLIGDRVLQDIAKFLEKSLGNQGFLSRPGGGTVDFIARLGGDEFILILNDANKEEAMDFAERLNIDFVEHFKDNEVISSFKVSLSIGIKIYNRNDFDPTTVLKNADDAMYQAKRLGKGQYYVFDETNDKKKA